MSPWIVVISYWYSYSYVSRYLPTYANYISVHPLLQTKMKIIGHGNFFLWICFHLSFLMIKSNLCLLHYQGVMVAIFMQAVVGGGGGLGSRLGKFGRAGKIIGLVCHLFCVFCLLFFLTFVFHFTSMPDRWWKNADRCGRVKGQIRIGRLELS